MSKKIWVRIAREVSGDVVRLLSEIKRLLEDTDSVRFRVSVGQMLNRFDSDLQKLIELSRFANDHAQGHLSQIIEHFSVIATAAEQHGEIFAALEEFHELSAAVTDAAYGLHKSLEPTNSNGNGGQDKKSDVNSFFDGLKTAKPYPKTPGFSRFLAKYQALKLAGKKLMKERLAREVVDELAKKNVDITVDALVQALNRYLREN